MILAIIHKQLVNKFDAVIAVDSKNPEGKLIFKGFQPYECIFLIF